MLPRQPSESVQGYLGQSFQRRIQLENRFRNPSFMGAWGEFRIPFEFRSFSDAVPVYPKGNHVNAEQSDLRPSCVAELPRVTKRPRERES